MPNENAETNIDRDENVGVGAGSTKNADVEDVAVDDVESSEKPLTFFEILSSTFAAAVGVQSKARRTRDFSRGKPLHFIMAGLIFAAIFVLVVVAVVRSVLSNV